MSVLRFTLSSQARAAGIVFSAPRPGDAGFDIRACEGISISPGQQLTVSTGLSIAVPLGFVGIVKDRSSMALRGIYSHAGVIDASYRGEVKILLSIVEQRPIDRSGRQSCSVSGSSAFVSL